MLWLAHHNSEINQRIGEVKIIRYPEEYKSSGDQNKKNQSGKNKRKRKRKRKKKRNKKRKNKRKNKRKKPKKEIIMGVKKVAKEWEIWNKEEKVVKSEEEAKKLVPQRFHKWIYVFEKKVSERILMKKLWDHVIKMKMKKGFALKKRKMYLLLRKERGEMHRFIKEKLRKEYIRLLKSPQIALVFLVGKKDNKKKMVQDYRYLNEWTIKNNYPLSLISDIVENTDTKKIFTKLNLQWGYNNV